MNSADRIAELEAHLEELEGRLFDLEPFPPRDAAYALLDTLDRDPRDVATAIDLLTITTVRDQCGEHGRVFAAMVLKTAQEAVEFAAANKTHCQDCQDKEAGAAPGALTLVGAEASN